MTVHRKFPKGGFTDQMPTCAVNGMLLKLILIMVLLVWDEKKWEVYCRSAGVLYSTLLGREIENKQ